jgi:hypothetical protein
MRGDGGDNRSAGHSTPISLISPYPHISFLYTVRVQIFWLRLCRAAEFHVLTHPNFSGKITNATSRSE